MDEKKEFLDRLKNPERYRILAKLNAFKEEYDDDPAITVTISEKIRGAHKVTVHTDTTKLSRVCDQTHFLRRFPKPQYTTALIQAYETDRNMLTVTYAIYEHAYVFKNRQV